MVSFKQGDLIKIENLKDIFVVVSKNYFNATGMAMLCPVVKKTFSDPLHLEVNYKNKKWFAMCEQVRMFDLNFRGFSHQGEITYPEIINITDAIQSIFDY